MSDRSKIDVAGHLALVVIVAAFGMVTSRYVLQPYLASQKNIDNFREAVRILSEADGSLEGLDEEIARVRSEISASEAMLPAEINLDTFLEEIGDLATSRGIRVEHLAPSQIRQHKLFRELVIQVHVKGSFNSIMEFMDKLESGGRLSRISNLAITANRDSPGCSAKLSLALYFAPEVNA
jgi:Tfp pilus assembly protein PilO